LNIYLYTEINIGDYRPNKPVNMMHILITILWDYWKW